jgi:hypothetical protein
VRGQGDLVVGGSFRAGRFAAPFERTNALDARLLGALPVPRALRSLRLKEWQAAQFGNQDWFACVALFNAKLLALVQVKLYDRRTRRLHLFERMRPPWELRLANDLLDSEVAWAGRGCRVAFRNRLFDDAVELELDVAEAPGFPGVRGRVTALAAGQQPLVVCIPFSPQRAMYSHKGLVPAEGELTIGSEPVRLARDSGYFLIDDHKGYYPWTMDWDWVTGAGHDEGGRLVGFNLTRNQSMDPERWNENAFWKAGRLHALPPVRFEHAAGRSGPETWAIRDLGDAKHVDLVFTIETDSRVDVNAGPLRSRYRGPFGRYDGELRSPDGERLAVQGLFGMGEDFELRC